MVCVTVGLGARTLPDGSSVMSFILVTVLRVADAVTLARPPRMPAMSEAAAAASVEDVDELVNEVELLLVKPLLEDVLVLVLLEEVDVGIEAVIVTRSVRGCPACGMMNCGAMLTAGCCGAQLHAAATAPARPAHGKSLAGALL